MDEPDKVRVKVELDRTLVDLASEAGLDLNTLTGRALQRALGLPRLERGLPHELRIEQLRLELRPEIAWYNAHVASHGLFSDEWRKF